MKRISVCRTKPVPEVLFDSSVVAVTAGSAWGRSDWRAQRGGAPGHQGIVSAVKMA